MLPILQHRVVKSQAQDQKNSLHTLPLQGDMRGLMGSTWAFEHEGDSPTLTQVMRPEGRLSGKIVNESVKSGVPKQQPRTPKPTLFIPGCCSFAN